MEILDYSYPVVTCPACGQVVGKAGLTSHLRGRRCRYARRQRVAEARGLVALRGGCSPPPTEPERLFRALGIPVEVLPYLSKDGVFYQTYAPPWAGAIWKAWDWDQHDAPFMAAFRRARDDAEFQAAIEAAIDIDGVRALVLQQMESPRSADAARDAS